MVNFCIKRKDGVNFYPSHPFLYVYGLIPVAAENTEQIEEQVDKVEVQAERTHQGNLLHTLIHTVGQAVSPTKMTTPI